MIKKNNISTKIKFIGILFLVLMISIISTTIYLNNKSKKDALIINVAGKQRMLTQNISKNVFYIYYIKNGVHTELDNSVLEFVYNLNSLKDGNELIGIEKAPTNTIAKQLAKVEIMWNNFYQNIETFKRLNSKEDISSQNELKKSIETIYNTNTTLLNEVDNLVSMYTTFSEEKTSYLKYAQYFFALIIIALIIYSFSQLRTMEENAKRFLEESKKIIEGNIDEPLIPIKIEAENEIVEATNTLNCFIQKINSAMNYSANAIEQSKNASLKLEELSDEFDQVINELKNSTDISKQLNKSEDIVIQSHEDLVNSTKKLQELKNELDKILSVCGTQESK